jgi:hypothetical protein
VEPPEVADGEEPAAVDEEDALALPRYPKYEGLGFASNSDQPETVPDIEYPPQLSELPTGMKLQEFSVARGVVCA